MSDHIESRMNFIVEQQALAVGIPKLQEAQARTAGDIKKLEEAQTRTDGMLRSLVEVNLSLTPNLQALGAETDRRVSGTPTTS